MIIFIIFLSSNLKHTHTQYSQKHLSIWLIFDAQFHLQESVEVFYGIYFYWLFSFIPVLKKITVFSQHLSHLHTYAVAV